MTTLYERRMQFARIDWDDPEQRAAALRALDNELTIIRKILSAQGGNVATPTVFTTTGAQTWTQPSGIAIVMIELWGAGGGGKSDGAGGGGGGYAMRRYIGITGDINLVIGAGGIGGSAGGNGTVGGNTTASGGGLPATLQASGGLAGNNITGVDGGGISGTPDVGINGGQSGATVRNAADTDVIGGVGGDSPKGGQGGQHGTTSTIKDGKSPGGGGAGGEGPSGAGGGGGDGMVVVWH